MDDVIANGVNYSEEMRNTPKDILDLVLTNNDMGHMTDQIHRAIRFEIVMRGRAEENGEPTIDNPSPNETINEEVLGGEDVVGDGGTGAEATEEGGGMTPQEEVLSSFGVSAESLSPETMERLNNSEAFGSMVEDAEYGQAVKESFNNAKEENPEASNEELVDQVISEVGSKEDFSSQQGQTNGESSSSETTTPTQGEATATPDGGDEGGGGPIGRPPGS